MIDALGFKGIWKRAGIKDNPQVVIDRLRALLSTAHEVISEEAEFRAPFGPSLVKDVSVSFLSDTVVLAVAANMEYDPPSIFLPKDSHLGYAVYEVANTLAHLLFVAAFGYPSLAYRGCIAVGDFLIEDSFVLGPAVDSAAELMNEAQGAFVWLSPDAQAVWKSWTSHEEVGGWSFLVNYDVPLKSGGKYNTFALAPMHAGMHPKLRAEAMDRILATFDGGFDVQLKKQETRAFLQFAADSIPFEPADGEGQGMESKNPPESEGPGGSGGSAAG